MGHNRRTLSLARLGAECADIVFANPAQASEAASALARALLDEGERRRAGRFRFARDRDLFCFSHALLRMTLARYLDAEPAALSFVVAPGGRPELAVSGPPPLRFNLTHTDGLVACIVSRGGACGVDAERIRDVDDHVIAAALTDAETAELAALNAESRLDRFYELWTLKEAYAKGCGLGLEIPLRHLDFSGCGSAWTRRDNFRKRWSQTSSAINKAARGQSCAPVITTSNAKRRFCAGSRPDAPRGG